MRGINELPQELEALGPILHDPRNRELPQSVRDSLPPIVVVDKFHKLNPNDTVIVVTIPESL